jgi:hypothetical protein
MTEWDASVATVAVKYARDRLERLSSWLIYRELPEDVVGATRT